ncbi:ADP-ribosylation factor-like protein 13B [Anthonomus grandis grandis]|uniref:ADP-ribosylation factor-like protein 13B n=1 Tax=Anthonomus grandis grandis TaxID=2921223 RepID=UPI0021655025|nr:ADP-ribosylation factor-like protein 13B [Anthonomus grandis grandis]
MGNSCCQETRRVKRQTISLLLVGLDNAGKTVAAKGLAGQPIDYPIPTIGFSAIELKYLHYNVKIFDLGGSRNIRGIWHKYFVDVHGVIFVVDSCDSDRFQEVTTVLEEILSSDKITGKPLLILANKQDQESAFDEIDIIECLKIEKLVNKYKCPTLVQSCCANEINYKKPDQGIKEGYQWIINHIHNNYERLNIRVTMDILEQEIKNKEEMIERIQRIRAERAALENIEDPDAIQTMSEYESQMSAENSQIIKPIKDLDVIDFYPNPEESEQIDNSTSDSSITFPEIYHVRDYSTEKERPKSAVQFVKHQLQMNKEMRRSQSAKVRRNKTGPSKIVPSKEFLPIENNVIEVTPLRLPRNVKTANERIFTISGNSVGPGGDFYAPHTSRERFDIETKKLPALRVKSKAQINREDNMNGICVVDVE